MSAPVDTAARDRALRGLLGALIEHCAAVCARDIGRAILAHCDAVAFACEAADAGATGAEILAMRDAAERAHHAAHHSAHAKATHTLQAN